MKKESFPGPDLTPGRKFDIVTAGGFLFREGRLLLERRSPRALLSPGLWDTPGGKLRPGESPEEALCRELREELGVEVLRFRPAGTSDEEIHREGEAPLLCRHYEFLLLEWKGEPRAGEGQELSWIPLEEIPGLQDLNPITKRILDSIFRLGWIPP